MHYDDHPVGDVQDTLAHFEFARISRTLDEYGNLLDRIMKLHTECAKNDDRLYTGPEIAAMIRERLMGLDK